MSLIVCAKRYLNSTRPSSTPFCFFFQKNEKKTMKTHAKPFPNFFFFQIFFSNFFNSLLPSSFVMFANFVTTSISSIPTIYHSPFTNLPFTIHQSTIHHSPIYHSPFTNLPFTIHQSTIHYSLIYQSPFTNLPFTIHQSTIHHSPI